MAPLFYDSGHLDVATVGLGDRVRVNALSIVDDQLTVGMLQARPNDLVCCPAQRVRNAYGLNLERTLSDMLGNAP